MEDPAGDVFLHAIYLASQITMTTAIFLRLIYCQPLAP